MRIAMLAAKLPKVCACNWAITGWFGLGRISLRPLVALALLVWPLLFAAPASATANSSVIPNAEKGLSRAASPVLMYQDDFEDGDYSNAAGASGLSWSLVTGSASG
jgi:hypothetical protein